MGPPLTSLPWRALRPRGAEALCCACALLCASLALLSLRVQGLVALLFGGLAAGLLAPWEQRLRAESFLRFVEARATLCALCGAPRRAGDAPCASCGRGLSDALPEAHVSSPSCSLRVGFCAVPLLFLGLGGCVASAARAAGESSRFATGIVLFFLLCFSVPLGLVLLSLREPERWLSFEERREGELSPRVSARVTLEGELRFEGTWQRWLEPTQGLRRRLDPAARGLARLLARWHAEGHGDLVLCQRRAWRVVLPLDAPAVPPAEPARAPYRAAAASEAPAWYLVARRSYQALWLEKLLPGVPLEEPREPYGTDPTRSRWLGPHPTGLSLAHLCAQLRASPEALAALAALEEEAPASPALQLAEQAVGETEGSELA